MNERWFSLTLLLISVGIRGSSCFLILQVELEGDGVADEPEAIKNSV